MQLLCMSLAGALSLTSHGISQSLGESSGRSLEEVKAKPSPLRIETVGTEKSYSLTHLTLPEQDRLETASILDIDLIFHEVEIIGSKGVGFVY